MSSANFELNFPDVPQDVMEELENDVSKHDYAMRRFEIEQREAHLKLVREKAANIEGFWVISLLSHSTFKAACNARDDMHALSFCNNIEVKQDTKDPRPFEITFHFRENPYFSDTTLTRKYPLKKGVAPAPEDGSITAQMRDFDPEEHLEQIPTTINWKSDETNLTKKYPRQMDNDDPEDLEGDFGSFFHYFTHPVDPWSIGEILREDLLPHVFEYFMGKGEMSGAGEEDSDADEDELDEEGNDDGEESLDEDEERYKKRRKA